MVRRRRRCAGACRPRRRRVAGGQLNHPSPHSHGGPRFVRTARVSGRETGGNSFTTRRRTCETAAVTRVRPPDRGREPVPHVSFGSTEAERGRPGPGRSGVTESAITWEKNSVVSSAETGATGPERWWVENQHGHRAVGVSECRHRFVRSGRRFLPVLGLVRQSTRWRCPSADGPGRQTRTSRHRAAVDSIDRKMDARYVRRRA